MSFIFKLISAIANVKDLFKMIMGWYDKYKKGRAQNKHNDAVKEIDESTKAAKEGSLEDRLKGGKRVEDNFNKHS